MKAELGKIHLLELVPGQSAAEARKLQRRYAMTGGVEISLKSDLTAKDLKEIAQVYLSEIQKFVPGTSEYRSNLAARALTLLLNHPRIAPEDKARILKETALVRAG